MRVLVVEDDRAIASALHRALEREGFSPVTAGTAADALNALPVDVVLLDLGLPDRDGVELLARLREVSSAPVIIVTARGTEEDRVAGLDLGADDYVVKPFGVRELVARMNAVLRRAGARDAGTAVQRVGALEVDRRARVVRVDGAEVTCTPKEYGIVEFLARDPGGVITRHELLDAVWGANWFGSTKMIDVHVAALRKKLGDAVAIETVRGVGFRLSVPR
ncbi:MAG TPA: response regulator transcription factor [Acidimicrobiales bacterium]|nr:MAG: DNA-binding response regulator [Actinobacteria bacterium 21-73-9]HQU27177.1 response regulator transcription factor [Acidimicrobiales bacterium]